MTITHRRSVHPFLWLISKHTVQWLMLMVFILLLSISNSAVALENNPGSNAVCPVGSTKGFLSSSSYSNILNSFTSNDYKNVSSQTTLSGNTDANIPLKIKMTINDIGINNTGNNTTITGTTANPAIDINRDFNARTSRSDITLDFQDGDNDKVTYLNKVALSVFDIDKSVTNKSGWDDLVKITGVTENNNVIEGTVQTIPNSSVIKLANGLQTSSVNNINCTSALASNCQGSVLFNEPVKSVTLSYNNTNNVTTPTTQRIQFRLDSYCYLPPPSYSITKDDGATSIVSNNITTYTIKVTNTGGSALQNIILKDPAVTGLIKQSGITCDTTDTTNTCSTPPTIAQLESATGFTIPSLAVGKSYSIKVPTLVTAASGSNVTNEANIKASNLDLKSAADTNTVTSIFGGGSTSAPATCPANHQMYYLGASPPTGAITPTNLSWPTGSLSNEYTFGGVKFKLSFSDTKTSSGIETLQSGYPEFSSYSGTTINALNVLNSSQRTDVNHRLTAIINKPVSKYGFVVQDLDTNESGRYIESMNLVTIGGIFSNVASSRHTLSNGGQTISGKAWENCNTDRTANKCDFNIDWGYKAASTPFVVTHGNTYNLASTTTSTGDHLVGYSDFYFCLAPPKLIVKKELNGNRVNDTDAKRDQFEIKATGGSIAANSFTTTGKAAAVTDNSSVVLELSENTSYKITERVMNEKILGDIANYEATYVCNNATTGSTTVMPTTAMSYDATNKTRSFTLANVSYGDEITCTITNGTRLYTLSGIVFDDNGGIASNRADKENADITTATSAYSNNSDYFNGVFNTSSETGIAGSSVKLVNCTDTNTVYATQPVVATGATIGRYQFSLPISTFGSNTNLCLIESRTGDTYPIRTSNENKNVGFAPTNFDYPNNDFGRVIDAHAAIVLKKYQYVNDCPTSLNYSTLPITADPRTGFSTDTVLESLIPGQCIAYKIVATNRANISVDNFVMRDVLQSKGVKNATTTSVLVAPVDAASDYAGNSVAIGMNGTVISNSQSIPARKNRDFYFNTKYGLTQ